MQKTTGQPICAIFNMSGLYNRMINAIHLTITAQTEPSFIWTEPRPLICLIFWFIWTQPIPTMEEGCMVTALLPLRCVWPHDTRSIVQVYSLCCRSLPPSVRALMHLTHGCCARRRDGGRVKTIMLYVVNPHAVIYRQFCGNSLSVCKCG